MQENSKKQWRKDMEIEITKDEDTGRLIEAFVESESKEGTFYKITGLSYGNIRDNWTCTCPAGSHGRNCKHIKETKEKLGI
jgi:uncharacterized Zn finger protein